MTSPTPAPAGPTCVARQIVVDAAPTEVFALLANPHRHHEVDGSGTVKQDVIGPRRLAEGDRFRVSMRMLGIPYAITSTVTRLEDDRAIEWRHPGGHRWRWEFEPTGDGRTRVTETFDHTDSPSWLMRLIKAPERNAEGIEKSLARLQRLFADR
ncbi:SRPBCC family protein [Mobilicoccus pelagius]|uniref:Dimethyladenosine transferase n=1 Tax=Mobilicoccus pelagius NBRC 104925 TaxID=1089455 RepID=H5UMK3_9MICO|nr:SRPBCC family protein [Mobilicoccus pelagius]GAB46961.1 hypothetical protein MOPEL_001_00810 [Mobilicoccus pelagius NBRC 104925]